MIFVVSDNKLQLMTKTLFDVDMIKFPLMDIFSSLMAYTDNNNDW